ncbi:phosphoribosylanthranilate isomerase [Flagellimonas flava]|uniref:N-(5'-phosphoribosyl)anthranilate isomerase n=1 Tax=Flagellimonas flava TaxID=570519 RepID=A0A1M5PFQ3_9FLAO|nr:phosphoribosylanthranilate isomerase [Allomuricauda flava]SHH00329.1 phosphoribosylanthranilate isomerase [Allomuricauda flava]
MKLKVCGMKYNPTEVAELQPDYMGFIFWEPSSRFFHGKTPDLPTTIKKVGVFVDAAIDEIAQKVEQHGLQSVQLHGAESPELCQSLKNRFPELEIIKVFTIKDSFNFELLTPYETVCDYYLFDTKGKLPGGNGYTFDWSILEDYPSTKPYFLSGGIGPDSTEELKSFLHSPASKYCQVIDVNSKFEIEPGLKNIEKLSEFKELLTNNH